MVISIVIIVIAECRATGKAKKFAACCYLVSCRLNEFQAKKAL